MNRIAALKWIEKHLSSGSPQPCLGVIKQVADFLLAHIWARDLPVREVKHKENFSIGINK